MANPKVTATRFGGISAAGTDGSLNVTVEYWLLSDLTKRGRFSTVVPSGNAGTTSQVQTYFKTHMATFLTTKYAPLTFGSADIMLFGF